MRMLLRRLRFLSRWRERSAELADELEFHRAMTQEDLQSRGLGREEAGRFARRALGSAALAQDRAREVWIWPWLDALARDARFGVRLLWKHPGFSAVAILTLAVAIGANTTVYTLVDRLLLRPLPYPDPDRLATIVRHYERGSTSGEGYSQNGATWLSVRDHFPGLDVAVDGGNGGVNVSANERTAYVQQQRVSAGFFRVLGVAPATGREFSAEDDRPGGPAVVVLSHSLWTRMFASDPAILGRRMSVGGEPFTIIGVMPAAFRSNMPADLWTPLRPSTEGEGSGQNYLLVARVRSGVRWADVSGQVESIGSALLRERMHPPANVKLTLKLVPFQQVVTQGFREPLLILWGAVGLVLLIGCVNLAGLILVRCAARMPEIATRIALGGGRGAIVRQLLVESLVLAACGGAAGVGLGYAFSFAIRTRLQDVLSLPTTPDIRVLAVSVTAGLLTGVVFGLVPALQAGRTDVRSMLSEGGSRAVAGRSRRWPSRALLVSQIAFGLVLTIGAGLMIRTFAYLTQLHPGFDAAHVVTGTLSLQDARYRTAARVNDLFTRSLERIRQVPGIAHAAVALTLPYERALNSGWRFAGEPQGREEVISLTYVTPEYFDALTIPLKQGRVFSDRDTAQSPRVAVVNEAFVRRYVHPDGAEQGVGVLDRRLQFGRDAPPIAIVGIVGDIQQRVNFGDGGPVSVYPAAYVPASQESDGDFVLYHTWYEPSWIVRTRGADSEVVAAMQHALAAVDPQLPFNRFRHIDEVRGEAVLTARLEAALLGLLAAIALLLCAIGIYGLVAQSVTERRRELGIRIALGATAFDVLSAAMAPAAAVAAIGAAIGLVLAAGAARLLQGLVFGVSVNDPLTFLSAAGLVIVAACVAALVPALRTLRLDTTSTLASR